VTWVYRQSTGELFEGDRLVAKGYSGHGASLNKPADQVRANFGPIPRGDWIVASAFDSPKRGPFCLRLIPCQGTDTFGRSGFLCHGDAVGHPGEFTASEGCIVLPRAVREQVFASKDHLLRVVE
jgi:hypothetical protein